MKNISFKRIIALMCSLVVLFTMFSVNIINTTAATGVTSTPTFSSTQTTGTLTINKVDSNSNPIENVGFTTIQVANIVQVTQEVTTGVYETSLMFLLTDAGKTILGDHDTYGSYLYGKGTVYSTDPSTVYCYSAEELQDALDDLIADSTTSDYSDIATYIKNTLSTSYTVYSGLTDSNGVLEINNGNEINIGVYLVVEDTTVNGTGTETKINGTEVEITEVARPFLVTIPQTEYDSNNSQYVWDYDVSVTPKNVVYSSSKKMYDQNGDEIASVGVGETYDYVVSAEIIATTADEAYTSYVLTDTAADGIEYLNMDDLDDFILIYLDNDGDGEYTQGTDTLFTYGASNDYTVSITDNGTSGIEFTVTFTDAGLAKLNAVTATTKIYFEYSAYLSKEAGTTGLTNSASISYKRNNGSSGGDDPDDPTVYTYSIDLTKEFAGTLNDPTAAAGVTFGIQDKNGDDIWAIDNSDGTYTYANITATELAALVAASSQSTDTQATANSDGTYTVSYNCNDPSSKYTVTYTKVFAVNVDQSSGTPAYKLSVGGLSKGKYTITELTTIDGYSLLADSFEVEITDAVYTNGSLTSGGDVDLTVLNETEPIFMLPFTGGLGSLLYVAIGFGFIALAIYLVVKVCGGKKEVQ